MKTHRCPECECICDCIPGNKHVYLCVCCEHEQHDDQPEYDTERGEEDNE